ncbi:hypothetical protein HZA96_06300 [Candidatus Woesearchaeota archaeon]|nr:hypothetical protein [Candidatus Woesearchaeota archaeon]
MGILGRLFATKDSTLVEILQSIAKIENGREKIGFYSSFVAHYDSNHNKVPTEAVEKAKQDIAQTIAAEFYALAHGRLAQYCSQGNDIKSIELDKVFQEWYSHTDKKSRAYQDIVGETNALVEEKQLLGSFKLTKESIDKAIVRVTEQRIEEEYTQNLSLKKIIDITRSDLKVAIELLAEFNEEGYKHSVVSHAFEKLIDFVGKESAPVLPEIVSGTVHSVVGSDNTINYQATKTITLLSVAADKVKELADQYRFYTDNEGKKKVSDGVIDDAVYARIETTQKTLDMIYRRERKTLKDFLEDNLREMRRKSVLGSENYLNLRHTFIQHIEQLKGGEYAASMLTKIDFAEYVSQIAAIDKTYDAAIKPVIVDVTGMDFHQTTTIADGNITYNLNEAHISTDKQR